MWRDAATRPAISHGVFGGLRRFAFNRNPRAANTPACVPRRYEFIVYIERASSSYTQTNCTGGKLQRLYSSNGSCIAACAPLQYTARSIVPRIYVHKRPHDMRGRTPVRMVRKARRGVLAGGKRVERKKDASSDYPGMHSINTHLHFDCGGDNWRFRFLVNSQRGKKRVIRGCRVLSGRTFCLLIAATISAVQAHMAKRVVGG